MSDPNDTPRTARLAQTADEELESLLIALGTKTKSEAEMYGLIFMTLLSVEQPDAFMVSAAAVHRLVKQRAANAAV